MKSRSIHDSRLMLRLRALHEEYVAIEKSLDGLRAAVKADAHSIEWSLAGQEKLLERVRRQEDSLRELRIEREQVTERPDTEWERELDRAAAQLEQLIRHVHQCTETLQLSRERPCPLAELAARHEQMQRAYVHAAGRY